MPLLSRARSLWRTLAHKGRLDSDLDDELRAAIATLTDRYERAGMDAAAARLTAERELGAVHAVRENVRNARVGAGVDACLIDLKFAWRGLRRAPGFTALMAATLALGIGANTALFSVVHALLLKPLPYRDSERLAFVWLDRNQIGYPRGPMSGPDYRDLRQRTRSFSALGGIWATGSVTLTGEREPEQLRSAFVTVNFFDVLGVEAAVGRTFRDEDAYPGAEPALILGWELFQRRFGGDPAVVGRTVTVNGEATRIVGVMPRDFRLLLPPGASVPDRLQAFVPFWHDLENGPRRNLFMRVVARMKPGVSLRNAADDVAIMAGAVTRETGMARSYTLVGLQAEGVREIRTPLLALFVGVGILLAIAGVNVASLLIARAAARAKETAVRIALGASRGRILRQLLVEGLLLTAIGAAAGIVVSVVCLRALIALAPASLARLDASTIDTTVLLFTIVLSGTWGVLFSLAPVVEVFKDGAGRPLFRLDGSASRSTTAPVRYRLRATLVVVQIALSTVLLVCGGLLVRAFVEVMRVDPGFRADQHLTFRIAIPGWLETREAFNQFADEVERRVRAIPGVRGAAAISHIPYDDLPNWALPYALERPLAPDAPSADTRAVSPGLLEMLGVTLIDGRFFDRGDQNPDNVVVIVDDLLARQLWPGQRAVGRRLSVRIGSENATVIGVVRHLRLRSLVEDLSPQIFVPWPAAQRNPIAFVVGLRDRDWTSVVPRIRAAVAALDPAVPIYEPRPLRDYVDAARATRRFTMLLAAAFAATALVLTCVGVYGVLAYAVEQRRHELGVRRALGADAARIVGAVVREAMGFALAGCAIGVAVALVAAELLRSQLYAVNPNDPVCVAGAVLLVLGGSLAACAIPARRAIRVTVLEVLR
jgi:putative ABC transport system permease protein